MASVTADLLREWILSGQSAWFRLRGESMQPFLPDGSRILVTGDRGPRIRAGDLLVFDAGDHLVCHRVLGRTGHRRSPSFLTKGDAGWTPAASIPARDVIGRVSAIERNGAVKRLDTPRSRGEALARAIRLLVVARLATATYLARRLATRRRETPGR